MCKVCKHTIIVVTHSFLSSNIYSCHFNLKARTLLLPKMSPSNPISLLRLNMIMRNYFVFLFLELLLNLR